MALGGLRMSDGVLAAIIAASASVFAALMQLKAAFTREAACPRASNSRSKSHLPRIEQMNRTESHLAGAYSEIESTVLRNIGLQGVVVMASVAPCKPALNAAAHALAASTAEASDPPAGKASGACGEADASPVTLCATVPANATVDDVELYVRTADSETPWSASRVTAGQDAGQARFADKPVEVADSATAKQVCESFVQWSSEHGRVARVVVRYTL